MTRDQARDYVKSQLESYLKGRGINTAKPFRCLNPGHEDNNPSMSYDPRRQRAHCFACGVDWDTFDVVAAGYGLTGADVFDKAYGLFGIDMGRTGKQERIRGETVEEHGTIPLQRRGAAPGEAAGWLIG